MQVNNTSKKQPIVDKSTRSQGKPSRDRKQARENKRDGGLQAHCVSLQRQGF